jgi:PAS domain S-box-containing protein
LMFMGKGGVHRKGIPANRIDVDWLRRFYDDTILTEARMSSNKKSQDDLLRKRAEKRLADASGLRRKSPEDLQKVIHELQVHQIELEMQNEALRKAQDELEESRTRYSDLYDFAPIGYFTFTGSGEVSEVNLTGAALLEVERGRLLRQPFFSYVAPGSIGRFRQHCRVVTEGKNGRCELELVRKSGAVFPASVESTRVSYGTGFRIHSAITDITDLKRAQAKADFEHIFRMAIEDSLLSGVAAVDAEGRQSYVNGAFCRMVGWEEHDLLGKRPPFPYWPPEEARAIEKKIQTAQEGNAPNTGLELRFLRQSGERFEVLLLVSRLESNHGAGADSMGWLWSVNDIARLKRTEAALVQSEEQLRHLSYQLLKTQEDERRRIAREIHDGLGQILSAIKFKIETIIQRAREETVETTIESLNLLVPLLQESVRESHRMHSNLRPSVLDDLGIVAAMSWLKRTFQSTFSSFNVALEVKIREDEVPEHLKIVIYRIAQEALNNVVKHSGFDHPTVSLRKRRSGLELAIRDRGKGFDIRKAIDSQNLSKGVGLSSMRERAELTGGRFSVESTLGKGTEVRVSWHLSGSRASSASSRPV